MLSAIPAINPSEPMLGNPFLAFESGLPPWDCSELFSAVQSPKPVVSSSGSEDPNQNNRQTNSGSSDEPNQTAPVIDERKRRRMISNRESARRSRMRKQKHVENLRNQVNRLRVENRELTNRLRFVLYHCHRVRTDNDRLRSEYSMLRQKLSEIRQILVFRQLQQQQEQQQQLCPAWPSNNFSTITSELQTPINNQLI